MSRHRSRRRNGRSNRYRDEENLNPMNYVSNLSDVMLILAVGIMLALILHWNVDIETQEESAEQEQTETITFSDDDLENSEELPEDMEHMGEVYYDAESGRYYVVEGNGTE